MESWFKVKELAQKLGLHEMTVRRYIKNGQLEAEKFGKRSVRVSESALLAFLAANRIKPSGGKK
jgi:excisionase family DNA binding protein